MYHGNKYHARRAIVDGITFDSAAEATRYSYLRLLARAGKISNLRLQVPFELIPTEPQGTKRLRAIKYIADFVYTDENGALHVEDVKGVKTAVYQLKKRLMYHVHGIIIDEV